MARPEHTDVRARHSLLSGDYLPLWGPRGIDQLESYDFGAERKRLKSPDRYLFNRAKRVMDGCLLDKLVLARGQVPLDFDEGEFNVRRFATRAWACGERVRYPTVFPKSLIRYLMTGGGIVANRGLVEMLESLFALADYRPSLSTLTFEGGDLHWRLLH